MEMLIVIFMIVYMVDSYVVSSHLSQLRNIVSELDNLRDEIQYIVSELDNLRDEIQYIGAELHHERLHRE